MSKKHDFGGMTIDASEPIRTSWGGPAFPSHGSMGEVVQEGMTLRDYFAAKATEEDINAHREGPMEEHIVSDANGRKHITHRSTRYTREQAKYRYADAMLKARAA